MTNEIDSGLKREFRAYSQAIGKKAAWHAARDAAADRHAVLGQIAEDLARDMDGFNSKRDSAFDPCDAHAHAGLAHYYINGFVGMPIRLVNPRAAGAQALGAFQAGAAKRREMGL